MTINFSGKIWYWRGPSPFHFVTVPPDESAAIKEMQSLSTYGWGMIPVNAQVGETRWYTALWPKDGGYILPLKDKVRKAEGLSECDTIEAELEIIFKG